MSQYTRWPVVTGGGGSGITALTGDVSASGSGSVAATVNSVGGSTAANIHTAELLANAATSSDTVSTIVKRDSNGRFIASRISLTDSQPSLFLTGGPGIIGTTDSEVLSLGSNSDLRLFIDPTGPVTLGADLATFALPVLGLGIISSSTIDSSVGAYEAGLINSFTISSTDQDNTQLRAGIVSILSLTDSGGMSTDYAGSYYGQLYEAHLDETSDCSGILSGIRGVGANTGTGIATYAIGGLFVGQTQGAGEVKNAIGGAFPQANSSSIGNEDHLAIGVSIGDPSLSGGIVAEGSTVSNIAIGLKIYNTIQAIDTAPEMYAINSESTAPSVLLGSIQANGVHSAEGHYKSTEVVPPSIFATSNAGTDAAAILLNATDVAGNIILFSGSAGLSAGSQLIVQFTTPYTVAPIVVITPTESNAGANATGAYVGSSTTTFLISFTTAAAPNTLYQWNYICMETQ